MPKLKPPTDQRAGVRPIAFVLQDGAKFSNPVTLKVRPEDLNRVEPSRASVNQTLGRSVNGWVDNFGEGLPSVTISGHTGWRTAAGSGEDGAEAFNTLNQLVAHEYHAAKQRAIDAGRDPATVKLLFVDMLDNFTWSVLPTQFVLRRSRSRPLLFQYQIALQAVSTNIDEQFKVLPILGDPAKGQEALTGVLATLTDLSKDIKDFVAEALAYKDAALAPIANTVADYAELSNQIFAIVDDTVKSVQDGVYGTANSLITIASDMATVGVNVNRSISAIAGLPNNVRAAAARVSSAYNEMLCILKNSLRPRKVYDDYDGLFGASNCSSTTGGRLGSSYASQNAFELMQTSKGPVSVSSGAYSSMSTISRSDPVLAPMSLTEIDRNLKVINEGVVVG